VIVTASATVLAQPKQGPKVLLLYDMEGITAADEFRKTTFAHPKEYAEGRQSLTADVNAAIAGLKAGGAAEIVVVDGHGSGNGDEPDILVDQIAAPGLMHFRSTPFDIYMDSYDHSIDAIVAIGMHAGAGNRTGFLAHTYNAHNIEYRVNGAPFNETMILAMGAARLKIPVIMVSGDDQLERELKRNLPWVKYAAVKHAVNVGKAEPLPRDEASRRIETAAREALRSLASMRVMDLAGPYRFATKFEEPSQAMNAALWPGAELLPDQQTVQIRANDFEDGYRTSVRLLGLGRRGPQRCGGAGSDLQAAERDGRAPGDDRLGLRPLDQWSARAHPTATPRALLGRAIVANGSLRGRLRLDATAELHHGLRGLPGPGGSPLLL
jgi:D-amino peptidase